MEHTGAARSPAPPQLCPPVNNDGESHASAGAAPSHSHTTIRINLGKPRGVAVGDRGLWVLGNLELCGWSILVEERT